MTTDSDCCTHAHTHLQPHCRPPWWSHRRCWLCTSPTGLTGCALRAFSSTRCSHVKKNDRNLNKRTRVTGTRSEMEMAHFGQNHQGERFHSGHSDFHRICPCFHALIFVRRTGQGAQFREIVFTLHIRGHLNPFLPH